MTDTLVHDYMVHTSGAVKTAGRAAVLSGMSPRLGEHNSRSWNTSAVERTSVETSGNKKADKKGGGHNE